MEEKRIVKPWQAGLMLLAGIAAGAVMAMLCQGVSLHDILTVMYSGFSADTGSDVVNSMLNRGGFTSMLSTIGLLIAAGIFGAPLRTAGVVDVLLAFVQRIAKNSRSMSLGVLILHAVFFTITGAYYVSYPVVGGMVEDLYPEYHLDRKNLMRTMLDTGTGLPPWCRGRPRVLTPPRRLAFPIWHSRRLRRCCGCRSCFLSFTP